MAPTGTLRGIIIPANPGDTLIEITIDGGYSAWLERMADRIAYGDMIEMVHSTKLCELLRKPWYNHILSMVVHEDGHKVGLAVNPRATIFYPHYPGIAGDAMIIGEDRSDPYEGAWPETLPDYITVGRLNEYIHHNSR